MTVEPVSQEMPIEACVASLQVQGMALWVEGGQLRFRGTQKLVDSPLFRTLKARKDEALALLSERPARNRRAALIEREDVTTAPLTELQRRWRELRRLGGPVDNHIRLLLLKGQLNPTALQASLKQLQDRHSILRMRIGTGSGGGFQEVIAEPPSLRLDEAACRLADLEGRAEAFAEALCDEAAGEVLRILLLRLEEGGFALVLCASRLALAWGSLNTLQSDLIRIYALLDAGAPPPPAVKTLRFLDYPLWQAERCAEAPPVPADWALLQSMPTRAIAARRKPRVRFTLDLPDAPTLAMLKRFHGRAAPRSVMMTVWSLALARLHGSDRAASSANVVDMPAVMQGVAGCFAGLAPLTADLTGRPSLEEAVMRSVAIRGNGTDAVTVAPIEDLVRTGAAAARIVVLPGRPQQADSLNTERMFRFRDFEPSTMVEDLAGFCFLEQRPQMLVHYANGAYSAKDMEEFQRTLVETIEAAAME